MWAIATLVQAGCAARAQSPEPVPLDRVECGQCRMLISTEDGTGEIVSAHDETQFYDDVRCLAAAWRTHGGDAIPFVRMIGGEWRDARTVAFAQPAVARTAMGSEFVAFATAADAKAADRSGRALTWDELLTASETAHGEPVEP
jgi:nitrous oxide reductase accessory protein NosL